MSFHNALHYATHRCETLYMQQVLYVLNREIRTWQESNHNFLPFAFFTAVTVREINLFLLNNLRYVVI